jgi:hypothetical protein
MHPHLANFSAGLRGWLLEEPEYCFHDSGNDGVRQHQEDDQRDEEENTRAPIGPGL